MSMSTAEERELFDYIIAVIEKGSAADMAEMNQAYAYADVLAASLKTKIVNTAQTVREQGNVVPTVDIAPAQPQLMAQPFVPQIPRVPPITSSPARGIPAPQVLSSQTAEVGQAHFDPDPVRSVSFTPGVPQRRTITGPYGPGGRQATVTGVYTPPGQLTTVTTDISNHPVVPTSSSTVIPASRSFSAIRVPSPVSVPRVAVNPVVAEPQVEVVEPMVVSQPAVIPMPRPITVRPVIPVPQAPTIYPIAQPMEAPQIYAPPTTVVQPLAAPQIYSQAPTPVYSQAPTPVYVQQAQPFVAVPSVSRFTY